MDLNTLTFSQFINVCYLPASITHIRKRDYARYVQPDIRDNVTYIILG